MREGLRRKKREEEGRWGPQGIKGSIHSNSGHNWKKSHVWITDNVKDANKPIRKAHKLPAKFGLRKFCITN